MTEHALPGKTEHETHEYLRDHGHRIAVAEAHDYLCRRIKTDENFPLPEGSEAVVAAAAGAMDDVHAARQAGAEAYVAAQLEAIHSAVAAMPSRSAA